MDWEEKVLKRKKIYPWNSLKNSWPTLPSFKIEIWDCSHNTFGIAKFDGWDFDEIEWDIKPHGSLMLKIYKITHWRNVKE